MCPTSYFVSGFQGIGKLNPKVFTIMCVTHLFPVSFLGLSLPSVSLLYFSSINFPTLCDFGGGRKVALGRGMKHKIIWACKDEKFISVANIRTRFEMV
jgi:hypothetical protein